MTYLLLIPAVISLYLVLRGRANDAFLYVYLPCLMLLPYYFSCRIPHIEVLSASEWASIPIGLVAGYRLIATRSFRFCDLLILSFLLSIVLSEMLREPDYKKRDGVQYAVASLICPVLVYLIGRGLIEPNLRLETVRRFVLFIAILLPLGLLEWRLDVDFYGLFGKAVFGFPYFPSQIRAGHGRAICSFGDAEIAGIIFGMVCTMNAWLAYCSQKGARLSQFWTKMERLHVPGIMLVALVLLTQSRGPLLGLAAGYVILQIRRFSTPKVGVVVVLVVLCAGGFAAYSYYQRYTDVNPLSPQLDEQQASAVYRRQMHELYLPILKQGGWLGLGLLGHPSTHGLKSIDDEFLLIQLGQGKLGLLIFILIEAETIRRLLFDIWKIADPDDRAFACSMLAALAVFWITIATVYMGEQLPQVAFLFIGWSVSVEPGKPAAAPQQIPAGRYAFRRILG